jgi:hypothetical protein
VAEAGGVHLEQDLAGAGPRSRDLPHDGGLLPVRQLDGLHHKSVVAHDVTLSTKLKSCQFSCTMLAMSSGPPLWLQAVYRLERAIGGPVESAVHSDTYFDVVSQANRARARAIGAVEGVSRRGLHLLTLPAGTDIRRVREQLSRMERRMNALTDELAALHDARDGVR